MILVGFFVIAGALASFFFDSLVPGILCSIIALCAFGWQIVSKWGQE